MPASRPNPIRHALFWGCLPVVVALLIALFRFGLNRPVNPVMAVGLLGGSMLASFILALQALRPSNP